MTSLRKPFTYVSCSGRDPVPADEVLRHQPRGDTCRVRLGQVHQLVRQARARVLLAAVLLIPKCSEAGSDHVANRAVQVDLGLVDEHPRGRVCGQAAALEGKAEYGREVFEVTIDLGLNKEGPRRLTCGQAAALGERRSLKSSGLGERGSITPIFFCRYSLFGLCRVELDESSHT
jgi:hypothetical protein